jgi:hypothetical protein
MPERLERASRAATRGENFRHFIEDPDIKRFFEAYEADRVRTMANAAPTEDAARRGAALELQAMRALKTFMLKAIKSGHEAQQLLIQEATENHS